MNEDYENESDCDYGVSLSDDELDQEIHEEQKVEQKVEEKKIEQKVEEKSKKKVSKKVDNTGSCMICTENFNGKLKKTVCPNVECNAIICRKCVHTWLLDPLKFNDAECMVCKIGLSRESLVEMCGKIWVNTDYARRREEILFDRIKSRLPEYQDHISAKGRLRNFRYKISSLMNFNSRTKTILDHFDNTNRNVINNLINDYDRYYNNINFTLTDSQRFLPNEEEIEMLLKEFDNEIKNFSNRLNFLNKRFENLIKKEEKTGVSLNDIIEERKKEEEEKEKKEKFLTRGPCPNNNCNGFIEDSWKCGICNTKICQSCMIIINQKEINEKTHVCKESDLESVKLIRSSSKPCPNCRVRVTKSEGCTQMWCTNCNTAFDYNTLEIIKNKKIHNPHYFDFIKKNGLGNHNGYIGECGITGTAILNKLEILLKDEKCLNSLKKNYSNIILKHLEDATHIKANLRNNDNLNNIYFNLGKNYLLNNINLAHFKEKIQREEKSSSKLNEVNNIRLTYADTVYDICNHILLEEPKKNNIDYLDKIINMLTENHEIAKTALTKNAEIYNSSVLNLRP